MRVFADKTAIEKLKEIIENHTSHLQPVRIYIESSGWSGVKFGLVLDEQSKDDHYYNFNGIKFIMSKGLYEEFGDFEIESYRLGIRIKPLSFNGYSFC